MAEQLTELQQKIASLSPANQLRLAAGLIEAKKYDVARALAQNVVDELYALEVVSRSQAR